MSQKIAEARQYIFKKILTTSRDTDEGSLEWQIQFGFSSALMYPSGLITD